MKNFNLLLFIALLIFISCTNDKKEANTNERKKIVNVTLLPVKYFVDEMAGKFLEVNVMVPESASPATYEPSPRQMQKLKKADAYLGIEPLSFEQAWMPRFKATNKEMRVFNLAENIELINHQKQEAKESKHDHEKEKKLADPHIWVSPSTVLPMIKNIKAALIELYPRKKSVIEKNYQQLKRRVEKKDQSVNDAIDQMENKSFLIFHPALGYLARDYGLNQIVIQEQGKEPSSREMHKIIKKAEENEVTSILAQKQFDMRNSKTIADEMNIEVNIINPLQEDWPVMVDQIVESLKKEK